MKSIDSPVEVIKAVEIFHLSDERLKPGTEVFSSIRRVNKNQEAYMRSAYEEGLNARIIE